MGVRGKVEQLVDNVAPASNITIQERRSADGLDAHVPMILRDGALYDPDLDRFFRDLPLNGVRSRHSLRAYGYDVLVWVRFLSEACGKSVWQGDRRDVLEDLAQTFPQKPLIGILLDLEHIGDRQHIIMLGKALAQSLAEHHVLGYCHMDSSQPFLFGSM